MDDNTIKLLFEQNLSSVKTFVQIMFENVQKEMKEIRSENAELKESLHFSQDEIDSLKRKVAELQSNTRNMNEVTDMNCDLSDRVRQLEDGTKITNLRITGIPDVIAENFEQTQDKVQKLLSNKLQLNNVTVLDAYRTGKFSTTNGPRPIIAKLPSVKEKISCLKKSNLLKGSNTYLSEDVSRATMYIRKQKIDELKRKRAEGFIAYFSGINIVTKRRAENTPQTGNTVRETSIFANLESMNPVASTSGLHGTDQPKDSRKKYNLRKN